MAKETNVRNAYLNGGTKFTTQEVIDINLDFDALESSIASIVNDYKRAGALINKHVGIASEFKGEGSKVIEELNGWSELFYQQLLVTLTDYQHLLTLTASKNRNRNLSSAGNQWKNQ